MANEERTVRRYVKAYDDEGDPDGTVYDAVWIDCTTGAEVMRYDAADPANTEESYGAIPDSQCFANKGLDINERVPISSCLEKFGGTKK